MTNQLKNLSNFLSGFHLAGKRLSNGKLKAYIGNTEELIDDWPQEVEYEGTTYTLEYIKTGDNGYETGIYV